MNVFLRAGSVVFDPADVSVVDFSEVESLRAKITMKDGQVLYATGPDVIDLAFLTRPSVLEGKRMRWVRHAWVVHNLVAHPAMQLLAFLGYGRLGVKIHDATIPRPHVERMS